MPNIALASAWHIHAPEYAKEVAGIPGVKITAVWDDNTARGAEYAKKWDAPYEPNLDKLLARPDIDGVLVASATNQHVEILTKCAHFKKHIFTEKVLATTYKEALALREAINKAGVQFCISFPFKSYPYNLFAKQLVEEGVLGDITGARIRDAHSGAVQDWLPKGFYDPVASQGGAMLDLGAHPMYLSAWLLGDKPVSVVSSFASHCGRELEDNASSILEYAGGALVSSEVSLVASRADMCFELYGTKGWFKYSGRPSRAKDIRLYIEGDPRCEAEGSWITPELPEERPTPLQQWINAINTGRPVQDIGIDAAVTLSLFMDAAYRSNSEGRKVLFAEYAQ